MPSSERWLADLFKSAYTVVGAKLSHTPPSQPEPKDSD